MISGMEGSFCPWSVPKVASAIIPAWHFGRLRVLGLLLVPVEGLESRNVLCQVADILYRSVSNTGCLGGRLHLLLISPLNALLPYSLFWLFFEVTACTSLRS